jgi:hypothetical protein
MNFVNFGVIAIEMNLASFNYLENISLLVQILKLLKYKQMSYSNSSHFLGSQHTAKFESGFKMTGFSRTEHDWNRQF